MSATPTDAEWDAAKSAIGFGGLMDRSLTYEERVQVDVIAQALADQRVRYEAVADELERDKGRISDVVARISMGDAAQRIRQVAQ